MVDQSYKKTNKMIFAYIRSSYKFQFSKSSAGKEGKEAVEVSPLDQEKHGPGKMKEFEIETAKGTSLKEVKDGEKLKDTVKKPKEASKQNPSRAINHTIPRPFVLETEKRMSQEKRAPEPRQPKSSRSVSRRKPQLLSTSAGSIPKRSTTLKVPSNKQADKSCSANGIKSRSKNQMIKGVDRNHSLVVKGNETKASNTSKLGNSSTFKALPLPSFYHKKVPASSKPGAKAEPKMAVSNLPSLSQPSKPNKSLEDNQKRVSASRTIADRAKETINRMFKSTQKALNPSKETPKVIAATA